MEAIITAVGDVFSLVGTTVTQITAQPILVFFLAASFAGVGIGIFKKLKRSVK